VGREAREEAEPDRVKKGKEKEVWWMRRVKRGDKMERKRE